jgi:hypothetical protein
MYLTRNQAYVYSVPGVRIPPSPPDTHDMGPSGPLLFWGLRAWARHGLGPGRSRCFGADGGRHFARGGGWLRPRRPDRHRCCAGHSRRLNSLRISAALFGGLRADPPFGVHRFRSRFTPGLVALSQARDPTCATMQGKCRGRPRADALPGGVPPIRYTRGLHRISGMKPCRDHAFLSPGRCAAMIPLLQWQPRRSEWH